MEVGVGVCAERPRRMLPCALRKSRIRFGVREGPSALSLEGKRRRWS